MTDNERKKWEKEISDWKRAAEHSYPWEPEWVKPNWHQNYEGKKYLQWLEAKERIATIKSKADSQ